MFDKASGQSKEVPIKAVAQEAGFYDPDIEVELNETVEKPANPVMDKLLRKEWPTPEERLFLAVYIAVMLKRVPYRRQRASSLVPKVLKQTVVDVRTCLEKLIGDTTLDQPLTRHRLKQVEAIYEKYKRQPPLGVVRQIREAWPTAEMIGLVRQMTWRVLETSGPNFFLTCDNPAFFFTAYGLKSTEAEVCFPLAAKSALHCCWQETNGNLVFLDASQSIVKEINRRLASTTARFAFYHERAEWVHTLLWKESPHLSRILW